MEKKKFITLILSVALIFFLNNASYAQEDLNIKDPELLSDKEIIAAINTKAVSIETFKAEVAIQVEKAEGKSTTIAELIFKRPDKSNLKGTTYLVKGEEARSSEAIMVSDGGILWNYLPEIKRVMKLHITAESSPPIGNEVIDPFFGLEASTIIYKGIRQIEGKDYYAFEAKTKLADLIEKLPSAKLFFDIYTNLLYLKATYNDVTKDLSAITYKKIELNIPVSDEDFTLSLPSDVVIKDIY